MLSHQLQTGLKENETSQSETELIFSISISLIKAAVVVGDSSAQDHHLDVVIIPH